ncbi:MAG: hypothetical protein A2X12_07110 [Bacteroidetes bacterium GWE2_29_8]|nr:MAG: hypothetical protein A2X12_07110 [Bacteroidetes bacterium GWE2_29_8]
MQKKQIVYEPNMRAKLGFTRTIILMIKNIIEYRELIYQLFKRDFLMSYKKSFLGLSWILIAPIFGIISWVFMNSTGILAPGDVGIPYPAYVLLGSSLYGLFMGFFTSASATLNAGTGFILQVNFPHDILLFKQAMQQFVSFLISFILTIFVLMLFGVFPSFMLLILPILVLPLFFLGAAIGLLSSIISVVAVDIQKGIEFLMGLVMFVTPVIYSNNISNPSLQLIIKYNPLTYLISGVRDALIYGSIPNIEIFMYASLGSFLFFLLALRLFFLSEHKIIEKML